MFDISRIIQKHKDGDLLSLTETQAIVRELEVAEDTIRNIKRLIVEWSFSSSNADYQKLADDFISDFREAIKESE